ncbi:MAG: FtsX-like permease family protein, partial [bacterium]|nr:FtsX-like permease family protein [bacterium]
VGVTRQMSLRGVIDVSDRIGTCFFVYDQRPKSDVSFIIKSDGDPRLLVEPLRSSLAAIDAEMPLSNVMPLSERLAGSLLARRASMALTGFFAGVALFLAAVGLYGVLVYLVTQRTREIGIRLSLGSSRSRVFQLVMSEGVGIVASGLVAGFLLVVALRSAVASQLYGVGPLDPAVLTIVSIALVAVACAACCIPALRATRIHPAIALKE